MRTKNVESENRHSAKCDNVNLYITHYRSKTSNALDALYNKQVRLMDGLKMQDQKMEDQKKMKELKMQD